ncbi:recombination-associated protein RdgC [Atlantibacter hermannii]|uniref:recombination-associated protein RdgC n=1 Tax=Atlantibacter hermannii TaxID=565 RepID=UPI0028AE5309|nr:recombination-associated protein RdgC [Atlantibacter hermannii]
MKTPFLKNVCIYRLSRDFKLDPDALEKQMAEFAFTPCGSQDMSRRGWVNVTPEKLFIEHEDSFLLCCQHQAKIIPNPVINDAVAERVAKIEADQGRKIRRIERLSIKDEVLHTLLPRAFSKNTSNYVWVDVAHQLVFVEASSARVAEDLLGLLRKTLGSLPVVPLMMETPIELTITDWLKKNAMPAGYAAGSEAVLKAILENGGALRVSKQDLLSDEITNHIDAGKLATTLALDWQKRITFRLADDMTIKAIHYADDLRDQNDDIEREDIHSRMVADFILFKAEFGALLASLIDVLGGEYAR